MMILVNSRHVCIYIAIRIVYISLQSAVKSGGKMSIDVNGSVAPAMVPSRPNEIEGIPISAWTALQVSIVTGEAEAN